MNLKEIDPFYQSILNELENAEKKHPHFCDYMFPTVTLYKGFPKPTFAEFILLEKISETEKNYSQGDYEACIKKLAQCGAVIFRMMEFVNNRRNENGSDVNHS